MHIRRVIWETNAFCNASCKFCFATFSLPSEIYVSGELIQTENLSPLSTEEAIALMREIASTEIQEIVFGGGDPFLRKDLISIVRKASRLNLRVIIDTNAIILYKKPQILEALSKFIFQLGIPIDAASAKVMDGLRGTGAFHSALGVLSLSQNMPFTIKINTVVTKQNYQEIPYIADLLSLYRVEKWSIDQFKPYGRGKDYRYLYEIEDGLYYQTVQRAKTRAEHLGMNVHISGGRVKDKDGILLVISPQGIAYVPAQGVNKFIGNIRKESFSSILSKAYQFIDVDRHYSQYSS